MCGFSTGKEGEKKKTEEQAQIKQKREPLFTVIQVQVFLLTHSYNLVTKKRLQFSIIKLSTLIKVVHKAESFIENVFPNFGNMYKKMSLI